MREAGACKLATSSVTPHLAPTHPLPPSALPLPLRRAANGDPDILPQALLRKYITYAKQMCRPKLQSADYDKIAQVGAWWGLRSGACATLCTGSAVGPEGRRPSRPRQGRAGGRASAAGALRGGGAGDACRRRVRALAGF